MIQNCLNRTIARVLPLNAVTEALQRRKQVSWWLCPSAPVPPSWWKLKTNFYFYDNDPLSQALKIYRDLQNTGGGSQTTTRSTYIKKIQRYCWRNALIGKRTLDNLHSMTLILAQQPNCCATTWMLLAQQPPGFLHFFWSCLFNLSHGCSRLHHCQRGCSNSYYPCM